MTKFITLNRFCRANVSLQDCLTTAFAHRSLQCLLQSPRAWRLAEWNGEDASSLKLDQVYEARLFCEDGELRWLRDPESTGRGSAAWLSEKSEAPQGFETFDVLDVEPLDGRILSYGDGFPGSQTPEGLGGYVIREYIGLASGTAGEDGNMIVVEQRILRTLPRSQTGKSQ